MAAAPGKIMLCRSTVVPVCQILVERRVHRAYQVDGRINKAQRKDKEHDWAAFVVDRVHTQGRESYEPNVT